MMTTNAANATVIELATHPVWRASRRYSRELAEAMRRHPSSYRPEPEGETLDAQALPRVPQLACVRAPRLTLAERD
ncbi:hypothetical protein MMAGJ_26040 [Mycolicibacterium mageritense]|uniref:Uncharacterized protein n=3 Tax=Mycobacteriaceae TaxID=1762 RepID=A0AAI8TSL5_MYCME|nr:hypothetical protein MMAGJ_26040 [Mycolicibacterium mageritense]BDY28081.1 hypothetical protein hbim_02011 [Mycolicibacterium mageritense]GJJ22799.1 hypothetical protein MTY414_64720 [Mycolicibacterium mageritense]CDO21754.1 hypothetical protein BN978_02218 [Mycolicibacterium mageritense DSM 44476 = CIP 104973]